MGSRYQGFQHLQEVAGDLLLSEYNDYSNTRSLLTFKCSECAESFVTTPFLYLKSNDGKRCINCKHKLRVTEQESRRVFIDRCIQIHGHYYGYNLIPSQFKMKDKIDIICPKHGVFSQLADSHLQGRGCNHCKIDYISQANRSNKTDFIYKSNQVHEFKYNYEQVEYVSATTNVSIKCPKHGEFFQQPQVHLSGSGCPKCVSNVPIKKLMNVLERHNYNFSLEKTFPDCVSNLGRKLRFDIYVPSLNLCIEYDGPHHFYPIRYAGYIESDEQQNNRLYIQQQNDDIKNKYCNDNNIELIRIPYTTKHPDALLEKWLGTKDPSNRYHYTYDMLSRDVVHIIQYIKGFGYDKFAVYGIARGGILFSVPVSYHFDKICEYGVVSYQRYDGNDSTVRFDITHTDTSIPIFIIDDLISSGITMNKVIKSMQHKFKKATIHPIVVFGDENPDNVFFVREHPKQWIVFPYEL